MTDWKGADTVAYKIIRCRHNAFQTGDEITAVLDSAADLNALSTDWAPGSVAVVADTGVPCYMLNASGVWKEI